MQALIAVIAGAGIIGAIWFVLRGRGASSPRDDGDGVTTRVGSDGFFICGSFSSGTEVRYEALVNGTWRRGIAAVSGTETFVYTGTPPTEVRIVGFDDDARVSVPSPPSSGPSSNDDDSGAFGDFPSAY